MTDTPLAPLNTPARPRKRSRAVALTILGAAAFALAGCREEAVEAEAFPDLGACKAAAEQGGSSFSSLDCEIAFQEAQTLHAEAAPRYESQEVCEELHGVGNCGSEQQATGSGGGSIFMPLIAGYLIGSMLGGGRQGMAASQPLYRTQDGRFTNAAGTAAYSSDTGRGNIAASQFTRPAATAGQPPMTRATAAARGGFGSSGSTRPAVGT